MEVTLSEFIAKTSCDPGLAQDLLNRKLKIENFIFFPLLIFIYLLLL